jgi:hypothetical protein
VWDCLKFKLARGVPSIAQFHKFLALLLTVGPCHICELIQSASTNTYLFAFVFTAGPSPCRPQPIKTFLLTIIFRLYPSSVSHFYHISMCSHWLPYRRQ